MAREPSLRASDSDREQVAERLRHATAEGRLTADELEERLEILYATRTYGELDALVADLPSTTPSRMPSTTPSRRARMPASRWAATAAAVTLMLAVLGAFAGAVRRTSSIHGGHLGPLGAPYHGMIVAASMIAVLAVLVVCAALVRLLMPSRRTTDA